MTTTDKLNIETIIKNAIEASNTMREACSKTNLHFNTFKKYAIKFNIYKPNQGSKGSKKPNIKQVYPLKDILNGKYPQYHTFKLKNRLIKEKVKEHKCEKCNLEMWNNVKIPIELNHIDGNCFNHTLENLEILCPNCHAQTCNYRGKNKNK